MLDCCYCCYSSFILYLERLLNLIHQPLLASRRLFQPQNFQRTRMKPFRLLAILREILHLQSRGQKLEVREFLVCSIDKIDDLIFTNISPIIYDMDFGSDLM